METRHRAAITKNLKTVVTHLVWFCSRGSNCKSDLLASVDALDWMERAYIHFTAMSSEMEAEKPHTIIRTLMDTCRAEASAWTMSSWCGNEGSDLQSVHVDGHEFEGTDGVELHQNGRNSDQPPRIPRPRKYSSVCQLQVPDVCPSQEDSEVRARHISLIHTAQDSTNGFERTW
jgi:hypothetical protein